MRNYGSFEHGNTTSPRPGPEIDYRAIPNPIGFGLDEPLRGVAFEALSMVIAKSRDNKPLWASVWSFVTAPLTVMWWSVLMLLQSSWLNAFLAPMLELLCLRAISKTLITRREREVPEFEILQTVALLLGLGTFAPLYIHIFVMEWLMDDYNCCDPMASVLDFTVWFVFWLQSSLGGLCVLWISRRYAAMRRDLVVRRYRASFEVYEDVSRKATEVLMGESLGERYDEMSKEFCCTVHG